MPDDRRTRSAAQLAARAPLTVSSLLGRHVTDGSGRRLGRVVDLIVEKDGQGVTRVKAVVTTDGPWGRLLGYERAAAPGPWALTVPARLIVRRHLRRVAWDEVRLED
jgi:sporulation protein YlmC with PRC-barrel domain